MMKQALFSLLVCFAIVPLPAIGASQGVVGATCTTATFCPESQTNKRNVCRNVRPTFYPGMLMLAAKQATIRNCQKLNALDYCRAPRGGCYDQCKSKVFCVYGDNR